VYNTNLVLRATPISKAPYIFWTNEFTNQKMPLQELLDKGFIQPSISPWMHHCYCQEKDDMCHTCIYYQLLNKFTIKNMYPLSMINYLFNHIKEAKMFSKFDLMPRYHHIKVEEEYITNTTFRTRYGHYEFLFLTF
jgi:hypothetical protein